MNPPPLKENPIVALNLARSRERGCHTSGTLLEQDNRE